MKASRLSILFLNSIRTETWGGGEKWMVNAAAGLVGRGHRVLLAGRPAARWLEQAKNRGLQTAEIPFRGDLGPINVIRLARIIDKARVDIIITNFDKELRLAAVARLLARRGLLIARKGLPLAADRPWYRYTYRRLVRAVICPSRDIKERLERFPWMPDGLIEVIPNGVSPVDTSGRRGSFRDELGIGSDSFLVGMIGRLEPWKGGHVLVEAAAAILKRRPDTRFVLVGTGSAVGDLGRQIRRLGLESSVRLAGFRRDIAPVLADLDLLCHPSLDEGLPNTVLEAMAAGLPVVGTRVGGVPELIEHGVDGLLVEPGDPKALSEAVCGLIEDPSRRAELGRAARDKARTDFSIKTMVGRIEDLLLRVASGVRRPASRPSSRQPGLAMITLHFPVKDGGVARWSYHLAGELGRRFPRCLVLARDRELAPDEFFENAPFRLVRMKGHNWKKFKHLYNAVNMLQLWRRLPGPTVVLAATWDMGVVPLLLSVALPLRVINAAHGLEVARPVGGLTGALLRLSLRRASAWIAVSNHVAQLLIEKGAPPDRVHVVPNGVDLENFHPTDEGEQVRRELNLGTGPVIITVSRIVERKGHDMVVRALPRIIESCPDARYLVVGKGATEKLQALAAELGVSDRVVFAGFVPDSRLRAYYNAADLYVMPSREIADRGDIEGFGITFLEAGACGLPVVAGRSGGIPDAVRDGRTGILVDPESPGEIAAAVLRILNDRGLARRMGEAGRRHALSLSWKRVAARIMPIIEKAARR